MEPILRTKSLIMTYRVGPIEIHALKGVDIEIKKGEFVAIVGPSGCGKSTLLYLMGGMAKPTSGSVFINEIDISKISDSQRTKLRKDKIGFVFQMFNLFPTLSAYSNLEIAMKISLNGGFSPKRIKEMLHLVGIGDRYKHKPIELSMGEQQRVAIARALVNNPDIVLADEPTGNLDTENSFRIINLMKNLNKELNQTIVMITHNLEAAKMTNRIIHMRDGKITNST
jgi:putative ABC transport system ATP-binding protein